MPRFVKDPVTGKWVRPGAVNSAGAAGSAPPSADAAPAAAAGSPNGDEVVLHATDIQAQAQKLLLERPNVLLLGDNLNDADVVAGLPASISCIKVGFANRPDAIVGDYLARFDAVVTGDGPMDFVHRLVQLVVTREQDT